jgi:hypothetical protein
LAGVVEGRKEPVLAAATSLKFQRCDHAQVARRRLDALARVSDQVQVAGRVSRPDAAADVAGRVDRPRLKGKLTLRIDQRLLECRQEILAGERARESRARRRARRVIAFAGDDRQPGLIVKGIGTPHSVVVVEVQPDAEHGSAKRDLAAAAQHNVAKRVVHDRVARRRAAEHDARCEPRRLLSLGDDQLQRVANGSDRPNAGVVQPLFVRGGLQSTVERQAARIVQSRRAEVLELPTGRPGGNIAGEREQPEFIGVACPESWLLGGRVGAGRRCKKREVPRGIRRRGPDAGKSPVRRQPGRRIARTCHQAKRLRGGELANPGSGAVGQVHVGSLERCRQADASRRMRMRVEERISDVIRQLRSLVLLAGKEAHVMGRTGPDSVVVVERHATFLHKVAVEQRRAVGRQDVRRADRSIARDGHARCIVAGDCEGAQRVRRADPNSMRKDIRGRGVERGLKRNDSLRIENRTGKPRERDSGPRRLFAAQGNDRHRGMSHRPRHEKRGNSAQR